MFCPTCYYGTTTNRAPGQRSNLSHARCAQLLPENALPATGSRIAAPPRQNFSGTATTRARPPYRHISVCSATQSSWPARSALLLPYGEACDMTERTKFAVIDCEDAPKWAGHESIWVAAYGRPGEHWCEEQRAAVQAAKVLTALPCVRREHFRAFAGELPEESELDTYRGLCITGRQDLGLLRATCGARVPWLTPYLQPPHRVRRDASLDQRALRVCAGAYRPFGCSARAGAALTRRCTDGGSPRRGESPGRLLRLSGAWHVAPHCSAAFLSAVARRSWLWRWEEASGATPLDAFSSGPSVWSSPARWRSVATLLLPGCADAEPRFALPASRN